MATFAGLIRKLQADLKPVEDTLGFKRYPADHPQEIRRNQLITEQEPGQPAPERPTLLRSYQQYFKDLSDLEAQDNVRGGRFSLLTALLDEGKIPTEADITSIKQHLARRHTELETKLKALNDRQYQAFEKELDNDDDLSFDEKDRALAQLKKAQQDQIEGLKKREVNDQRYLTNFRETQNRAAAAEHILRGLLPDDAKAMGTPYRFGPFAAIKKKFFLKGDETEKYDSPEEVAMDIAEQSAASMQRLKKDATTGQWIAEEEDKKKVGGRRKRSEGAELDWPEVTSDYFAGRDRLTFEDAPSAGVFKARGPMRLARFLNLSGGGALNVNLNTAIHADTEKGIPAAEGAVTCVLEAHITSSIGSLFLNTVPSPVIGTLNILAQIYMAKGWTGVDLGYETPEKYWDEAYLACRRAGFPHEEILFRGNMMTNKAIIEQGNAARNKIEAVYNTKRDKPGANIADALQKLAIPINDPNPKLDPRRFFHLLQNKQLALFKKASLEQRAAILTNSAFSKANLGMFLNYVALAGEPAAMSAPEKAKVLEVIYRGILNSHPEFSGNPDRAFEAFKALPTLPSTDRLDVFKSLNSETAAYLLMRSNSAERLTLFKGSSPETQATLLKQPGLSDGVIYALYNQLATPQERDAMLTELAKGRGSKALGVIVAKRFVDDVRYPGMGIDNPSARTPAASAQRDREVSGLLEHVLEKTNATDHPAIMSALYAALPSGRRQKELGVAAPGVGAIQPVTNDNFLSMLARVDDESEHTRWIQDLYRVPLQADTALGLAALPKPNEAEIDLKKGNLTSATLPDKQAALAFFFQLDTQQAANALLRSTPADRSAQLNSLIVDATDPAKQRKVVAIATALGANIVGKAFNSLANKADLITFLRNANKGKFLAEMLTVHYNTTNTSYDRWNVGELTDVIPHLNHPQLIRAMLTNSNPGDIVQLLRATEDDPIQQANIFRSLPDGNPKLLIFNALLAKYRQELFHYLAPVEQQARVVQRVANLDDDDEKKAAANEIIAYLSHPLLKTGDRDALYRHRAIQDNIGKVIQFNSTPTVMFLASYLKNAANLNTAFEAVMKMDDRALGDEEQKANYLDKVARALTQLPQDKQTAVFQRYLAPAENDDAGGGDIVRKQLLIHLATEKNGVDKAKTLFDSVPDDKKPGLKAAIKAVADGTPGANNASPFKKELYEMIGEPVPRPAAAPAPPPGPGARH